MSVAPPVLLATLAVTSAAVAAFLAGLGGPEPYLALFTLLFALRVAGQLVVCARGPRWLPPMQEWNLLPYPILLPLQLVLLALLAAIVVEMPDPGAGTGRALVVAAFAYWAAMAVRYAVRMGRRPAERWSGGAIPIVFHCVLAAFLFVLGVAFV